PVSASLTTPPPPAPRPPSLTRRASDLVNSVADAADLYAAGLSSFASVQLMLGLEEAFDIEFPDHMLNRKSFASIAAIEATVNTRSEEHTSELQSRENLVCRLLLGKNNP